MPVLPIIADRFNRTTKKCLFTGGDLFLVCRLLINKGITIRIRTHEVIRRGVAADIAIYA